MNALAINCGSSSIKWGVFAVGVDGGRGTVASRRAHGRIERIGGEATLHFELASAEPLHTTAPVPDHDEGVRRIAEWVAAAHVPVEAVGHRVVHGGSRFRAPTVLDDGVVAAIHDLETLAPLHNGPSLAGIRACRSALGLGFPMAAIFDTAFHASLPERAWRYAIPHELAARHGIRRFGFHGISYRAVLDRYCAITGTPEERATMVALHFGNGCSAAAIENGRSVDTSMGLTPLQGLVMGTRFGDVDPGILGYLSRAEAAPVTEVERWLNERSGLLGLSGRSGDLRDLLAHEPTDQRAAVALEVFCYRIRKYVGAYLAALGGAQAVVFTGAIGERSAEVRVINVVNLMKLQPQSEHPHGLSDREFDTLFTTDTPTIFAFHGYPWLIHRLTYRRTNHKNLHVRGYKEEGTTTTPFDMVVRNDLDRFHLVADVIDRVPGLGATAAYAKQTIRDKLIEHRQYIGRYGEDMPEVREWTWSDA